MQQIRLSVCAENKSLSHIYLITTQEQFFSLIKKEYFKRRYVIFMHYSLVQKNIKFW